MFTLFNSIWFGQIQSRFHTQLGIRKKNVEVILQIGSKALALIGEEPETIVGMLESYEGVIDRVLLDKSGGRGVGMDSEWLIPMAGAIRERFPDLGLVVAGGLGPETTNLIGRIPELFLKMSYDAQSKLRPSGSALDPVDWEMAAVYLIEMIKRMI